MDSSKLSSKFQLTLPKRVREDLEVEEGDRILFVKGEGGQWTILRVPSDPLDALRYLGERAGLTGTPSEVRREMESWEE
ncbi:hypothetical protein AKJ65_03590 [candidate division MSBL1 archaeon SCGC-AAA259E19]|uniref:SpoVT-AbrB domain-containing protein n=1 Tax=candidate division MSBL1 archaeon SCGC-AAA259E19 TaxID=1698264 RepID=A0A133UKL8_9EURY|nr:hypothetical protein AKJ65_03590 [candidate division MSBL1 archaeon SCGC-AAA259E19]